MKNFKVIAFPIAILVWVGTTLLFINYYIDEYQALEERRLEILVNYAVDAAVDEMVKNSEDLGLDYADIEYAQVDPDVALDMFTTMMLKGLGMSDSEANRQAVRVAYVPVFCVAAYDGYYIATPTQINSSGAMDSIFSVKQPYLYQDSNGVSYALNLGRNDCKKFDGTTLQKVTPVISELEQKTIINACVSDAVMSTAYEQLDGYMLSTVYFPSEMTSIVRTNPIENITVLAYVSNVDIGFSGKSDAFGIGGARIVQAKYVVGYVKDGRKLYTYSGNIDSSIDIIEVFENAQLAAEAGYYFDVDMVSY